MVAFNPNTKIIFIHPPRAGTTVFIERSNYQDIFACDDIKRLKKFFIDAYFNHYIIKQNGNLSKHMTRLQFDYVFKGNRQNFFYLTIIRNPFMRIYKWYKGILPTNFAPFWTANTSNFNEWVCQNLPQLYLKDWRLLPLYLHLSSPPKNTIRPISMNEFHPNGVIWDQQMITQMLKSPIDYDMIIRFENIENDMKKLSQYIDYQIDGTIPIKDNDNLKTYHDKYSTEARQIVEKLYKVDLDYFNYEF